MTKVSVIIIGKNVASSLAAAIHSAGQVSDDVVYVDSGSTDDSLQIAEQANAYVVKIEWKGFGDARNKGAKFAKHTFICNIDADEVISPELASEIRSYDFDPEYIYGFKRRNFFNRQEIRFGEWGNDDVYRIYHRDKAKWNLDDVHEMIESDTDKKKTIPGALLHYTTDSLPLYRRKLENYASLSAEKFFKQGRKAGIEKKYFSPFFGFIKNFFFFRGFMDGKKGWQLAKAHARYTKLKYRKLDEMWRRKSGSQEVGKSASAK